MTWSRSSRQSRGYGSRWDKLRQRILERDKHLCQECLRQGFIAAGNQVDHRIPKAKGGSDDEGNLECLCRKHHDEKTIRDAGGKPRPAIGADGWPIE